MNRHAIAALVMLASAANAATAQLAKPITDTLRPGVVRVRNSGPSLWAGTTGWKIVPDREFTVAAGSPGELGRPFTPALADDGTLYVIDRDPVGIKVFDTKGALLRVIGRNGTGPGEFGPRALIALHGDTLVVLDRSTRRVLVFDRAGKPISEHLLVDVEPDDVLPSAGSGRIPVIARSRSETPGVVWMNTRGEEVARTQLPPEPAQRTWKSCALTIPFQPRFGLVPDAKGEVIWGLTDALRFVRTRTGADTLRRIEATGIPPQVTSADRERTFGARGSVQQLHCTDARPGDLPSIKPMWMRMHVDAQNNLWVALTPDPDLVFAVFTSDGRLLGRVVDPTPSANNRWWFGDRAVEFIDLDDGGTRIRIWRVERGVR